MATASIHVHNHNPRFPHIEKHDGWGIHAGRLPMYSPVWTNDKGWAHRLASDFSSSLSGLPVVVSRYLPFFQGRSIMTGRRSMTTAPGSSNFLFILLCGLWYSTSALSSNTGKAILNQFRYPITLTFVQFGFVAFYCLLFMSPVIRFTRMRMPTRAILRSTFPMGMFQVGGHIFSSIAISRISVSTVHTIKALSPLFTVAAYALLFGVRYSSKTYLSLLPLTIGVMLACSFDVSASNAIGILCAFGSALVFVSSNIFFKKVMPSHSEETSSLSSHKLDKINLLLYSSGMAFLLMIPLWVYYDLPLFLSGTITMTIPSQDEPPPHSVVYYFFINGTVHYAQNIIAFVILSSTSPVTYSIASLIKRVAVICIAIVWFKQSVHPIQALGIGMTFAGLYMYNNSKGDVDKGEKKLRRMEAAKDMMLPTTKEDSRMMLGTESPPSEIISEYTSTSAASMGSGTVYGRTGRLSISGAAPFPIKNFKDMPPRKEMPPLELYPLPPPSHDSPLPVEQPTYRFPREPIPRYIHA